MILFKAVFQLVGIVQIEDQLHYSKNEEILTTWWVYKTEREVIAWKWHLFELRKIKIHKDQLWIQYYTAEDYKSTKRII